MIIRKLYKKPIACAIKNEAVVGDLAFHRYLTQIINGKQFLNWIPTNQLHETEARYRMLGTSLRQKLHTRTGWFKIVS